MSDTTHSPTIEVFHELALLAIADGAAPMNALPGCWERKIDGNWFVAVNGTAVNQKSAPDGCMEVELEPYHAAVWWNGWLAGLLSPFDGCIAAHPEGANEDTLIAAIRRARGN